MLSSTDEYSSQCFENPSRWALHVLNDLPLFTWDRVALIGDAVGLFLLAPQSFDKTVYIGPCHDIPPCRWSWSSN